MIERGSGMDKDVTFILGEQEQGHVILTKQRQFPGENV